MYYFDEHYKINLIILSQSIKSGMARIFLLIDISPGPFLTSTFELIIIKQVYSGGGRKWLEVSCKAALPTTFLEIRKYPHKIKNGISFNLFKKTVEFDCKYTKINYYFLFYLKSQLLFS